MKRSLIAAVTFAVLAAGHALAQYPVKPVRMVVPYPPGGGADVLARVVARSLSEQLGQQFVVDNRPGAAGTIGAAQVAAASADGYTLLAGGNPELTLMPHILTKLTYDPLRDLAPLVLATYAPAVVVVPASSNAKSMKELFEQAKKTPVPYGSPGRGTPMHIAMEIVNANAGTQFSHVPYKGGGPATQDVLGGQIGMAIINLPPLLAHLRAGKLRALAVMQDERSPQLPDVPTMREALGAGAVSAPSWFAFSAPAKIPRDVAIKLESEIRKTLGMESVRTTLAQAGMDVAALPAERFVAIMRAESAFNADAIKRFKLQAD